MHPEAEAHCEDRALEIEQRNRMHSMVVMACHKNEILHISNMGDVRH